MNSLQRHRLALTKDLPAGKNLEYDSRFAELQRISEGVREQQYGETIIAAQSPDWRAMRPIAEELAGETRDLRVGVMLAESIASCVGLTGLADGLELIRDWTCDLWDSVYPQLEPEDNRDPFARINSLSRLCEPDRLPNIIANIALIEALPHVKITFGDLCASLGELPNSRQSTTLTANEIEAALLSLSLDDVRALHQHAQRCQAALEETARFLNLAVGPGALDIAPLLTPITSCAQALESSIHARLSASDSIVSQGVSPSPNPETLIEAPTPNQSFNSDPKHVRVQSREDAALLIEAATQYFERCEPSSPVPLLLRRAKRMINQDFVDILRDLAPDALLNAQLLAGDAEAA